MMTLHRKRLLLNKLGRIVHELGYDVARLSTVPTANERRIAERFGNAVQELFEVQSMLAANVKHIEDGTLAMVRGGK